MRYVSSRKHAAPLPAAALAASLALALPAVAHASDLADSTDSADGARDRDAVALDKVEVHGLRNFVVSPKFTQTLQDTPQTIEVFSKDRLEQQGATTLTEALRNSPGVGTFYAGENGATSTGDSLYMRGFDSSSSIFVDGARDLGAVSRDLFDIDQVEVVKGPAGTDTGRSAPTGAINLVTRQAVPRDINSGSVSVGDQGQRRATADWNAPLGDDAALRIDAMWQDSDVAGRDRVNQSRWGIAPSIGFGLSGDTKVWLNLLHVEQDNIPDGFVPTIGLPGWLPQPGLEQLAGHPVDPSNYYGSPLDHDRVTADMATLRFEHAFGNGMKLSNTLRWGRTQQDYFITSYTATGGDANHTHAGPNRRSDIDDLSTYTLQRSNFSTRDQENRILTDQLNLRADFATGRVDHFVSAGAELTREEQTAWGIATSGNLDPIDLYDPDWASTGGTLSHAHSGAVAHGRTDTAAAYLFDTLEFGTHLLLTAGVRADRYDTRFDATAVCTTALPLPRNGVACPAGVADGTVVASADLDDADTLLNYKLGLVYKPVEALSLYANAALSQQPPGGANFTLNTTANSADNLDNDPQKARTYEIGAKWLFDDAFAFNLALFRTDVTNEIAPDPDSASGFSQIGEKRVQGVEISATGNITERWNLSLGYLHQNATVEEGAIASQDGSDNLSYTPGEAFTSWTTYELPFGLTVGGGIRYTGGLHKGTDGAVGTPDHTKSWTVYDAVVSYSVNDHFSVRLNGYNLFDKKYVAAINKSGYRYSPGTPRTFMLSVDYRF
jgi:catecholate siderophore receptor